MKVVKLVERELKEVEKETIQRFQYYLEEAQFALIGNHVIVMLDDKVNATVEELKKVVKKEANRVMSNHPDFAKYGMDDGYGIVVMGKWSVVGVSSQELSDEEKKKEEVGLGTALVIRAEMMECCDNLNIIALVLND